MICNSEWPSFWQIMLRYFSSHLLGCSKNQIFIIRIRIKSQKAKLSFASKPITKNKSYESKELIMSFSWFSKNQAYVIVNSILINMQVKLMNAFSTEILMKSDSVLSFLFCEPWVFLGGCGLICQFVSILVLPKIVYRVMFVLQYLFGCKLI